MWFQHPSSLPQNKCSRWCDQSSPGVLTTTQPVISSHLGDGSTFPFLEADRYCSEYHQNRRLLEHQNTEGWKWLPFLSLPYPEQLSHSNRRGIPDTLFLQACLGWIQVPPFPSAGLGKKYLGWDIAFWNPIYSKLPISFWFYTVTRNMYATTTNGSITKKGPPTFWLTPLHPCCHLPSSQYHFLKENLLGLPPNHPVPRRLIHHGHSTIQTGWVSVPPLLPPYMKH